MGEDISVRTSIPVRISLSEKQFSELKLLYQSIASIQIAAVEKKINLKLDKIKQQVVEFEEDLKKDYLNLISSELKDKMIEKIDSEVSRLVNSNHKIFHEIIESKKDLVGYGFCGLKNVYLDIIECEEPNKYRFTTGTFNAEAFVTYLEDEIKNHKPREWKKSDLDEEGNTLLEMDHIIPIALGGDEYDLNNLQTLCKPCHKKKTSKEARQFALARKNQKTLLEALHDGSQRKLWVI